MHVTGHLLDYNCVHTCYTLICVHTYFIKQLLSRRAEYYGVNPLKMYAKQWTNIDYSSGAVLYGFF